MIPGSMGERSYMVRGFPVAEDDVRYPAARLLPDHDDEPASPPSQPRRLIDFEAG